MWECEEPELSGTGRAESREEIREGLECHLEECLPSMPEAWVPSLALHKLGMVHASHLSPQEDQKKFKV